MGAVLDIAADLQLLRGAVEGAVEATAEARGWAWLALVPAAYLVGDAPMALEACERGRALFEEAGDTAGVAATSYGRGVALFLAVGDLPAAQTSFRDGQRLARSAGAVALEAWCLAHWVQLQCYAGPPTARTHQMLDQARQLSAESADPLLALQIAHDEATVAYCEGDFDACVESSLRLEALSLQTGSQAIWGQVALLLRGAALLGKHQPEAATSILLRAARNELDRGSRMQLEILPQVLARVADGLDPIRAAQLWGAATVHAQAWPGLARHWFPSRARLALGERFEGRRCPSTSSGRRISTPRRSASRRRAQYVRPHGQRGSSGDGSAGRCERGIRVGTTIDRRPCGLPIPPLRRYTTSANPRIALRKAVSR